MSDRDEILNRFLKSTPLTILKISAWSAQPVWLYISKVEIKVRITYFYCHFQPLLACKWSWTKFRLAHSAFGFYKSLPNNSIDWAEISRDFATWSIENSSLLSPVLGHVRNSLKISVKPIQPFGRSANEKCGVKTNSTDFLSIFTLYFRWYLKKYESSI